MFGTILSPQIKGVRNYNICCKNIVLTRIKQFKPKSLQDEGFQQVLIFYTYFFSEIIYGIHIFINNY